MSIWTVIATGQSLTRAHVAKALQTGKVCAVSNAWELVPQPDIVVSSDAAWWDYHQDARKAVCPKYCGEIGTVGITRIRDAQGYNSGLLGIVAAIRHGAKEINLIGFDLHGTHYFGTHPDPLKNPEGPQFRRFVRQFTLWQQPTDVTIINRTPGTALERWRGEPW